MHENPVSLDVLYAKVGAVEEGLAATANGSANLIQELQQKMQKLEGAATAAPGMGVPVQAGGTTSSPRCPAQAERRRRRSPKREPKPPPGFNPPVAPKPAETKSRRSFPALHPRSTSATKAAPAPDAPGLGNNIVEAPAAQPQVDTKKLGDDYKVEEGTPPQDCHRAGGDDAGIQLGVAQV